MNSKSLFGKALTMGLTFALIAVYSMVTLAVDGKATGEIVVKGSGDSSVIVNGEVAQTGRTILSSSTISTTEGASAVLNLGKAGRLEIAPNTTFVLSFDSTAISGDLASGSVTVLSAAKGVSVKTASGETIELNSGETASANSAVQQKQAAAAAGSPAWWVFALVLGGVVAGTVVATTMGDDDTNRFGTTTVSSTR